MAAGLPRQDAFELRTCRVKTLLNYGQLVRFHKNKFDEMLCKLDPSEYARPFKQNPTMP